MFDFRHAAGFEVPTYPPPKVELLDPNSSNAGMRKADSEVVMVDREFWDDSFQKIDHEMARMTTIDCFR